MVSTSRASTVLYIYSVQEATRSSIAAHQRVGSGETTPKPASQSPTLAMSAMVQMVGNILFYFHNNIIRKGKTSI